MDATFAIPRLPTPMAMRAPGLRFSPKPEAASSFCTVEEISATRRSGNFWWILRRREKLINLAYGEARCIWETPGTEARGARRCPAAASARRAFSLRPYRRARRALLRRVCETGRPKMARLLRRPSLTGRDRTAALRRRAIRATAPTLAEMAFFGGA